MSNFQSKPWVFAATGLLAGLLVAAGVWLGKTPPPGALSPLSASHAAEQMLMHAGAGTSNDAFAICTGPLEDGEGLFMLDFLTGELTCTAIHPRTGRFAARMTVNVVAALGIVDAQKKPRYLLSSGMMDFPRGGGANRPAASVIYVVDANTGAFAAYSVPWNPNVWNAGAGPLVGQLVLLDVGRVRNVAVGE